MELRVVEKPKVLLSLDPRQSLMRQVFLPHDEELEIGTEEQEFEAFRVLLAVILDDSVEYVDDDQ